MGHRTKVDIGIHRVCQNQRQEASFGNLTGSSKPSAEAKIGGSRAQVAAIRRLIDEEFPDIFSNEASGTLKGVSFVIDTDDAIPVRSPPYRTSPAEKKVIRDYIDDQLRSGNLVPSSSPWASPVILVDKFDGTKRVCGDYRKLNKATVRDSGPLPMIQDLLDQLQGKDYFSKVDFTSGFIQIPMDARSQEKTAIITHRGLFE